MQVKEPEEVAKMHGHVDTDMVRKHYAPWVEEMDQAHIGRVVRTWEALQEYRDNAN